MQWPLENVVTNTLEPHATLTIKLHKMELILNKHINLISNMDKYVGYPMWPDKVWWALCNTLQSLKLRTDTNKPCATTRVVYMLETYTF